MSIDFVAGWCGGAAGTAVGQPFDTVKARLQTDGLDGKKVYRGVYHCFSHIVRHEGPRALFKGMAAPLMSIAALNAVVFGIYGNLMNVFRRRVGPDQAPALHHSFISGAVAGFAQVIICSPTELIKLRLQYQKDKTRLIPHPLKHHTSENNNFRYSGPWDALKKVYRTEGLFRGLGKGYWVTCAREVPFFAVYFVVYEYLCREAVRRKGVGHTDQLGPGFICLAGGAGGTAAWLSTYPTDVVKSRYQIDGMAGTSGGNSGSGGNGGGGVFRYRSSWDCFRQSAREGWRVFLTGLSPTIVRAFPVNAVTFVTVALVIRAWRKRELAD